MIGKIIRLIIYVVVVIWLVIVLFDYLRFTSQLDPKLCLKKETHEYNDGRVYECTGLGYKVFKYDRTSLKMSQFGPMFFTKEKQPE